MMKVLGPKPGCTSSCLQCLQQFCASAHEMSTLGLRLMLDVTDSQLQIRFRRQGHQT